MIPQVDWFSFVFLRKSTTPQNHFEINWPLTSHSAAQLKSFRVKIWENFFTLPRLYRKHACFTMLGAKVKYTNVAHPYSKSLHQPWNAFYPLPATKTTFFARFGWGEDMKLMTGVANLFSFVFFSVCYWGKIIKT